MFAVLFAMHNSREPRLQPIALIVTLTPREFTLILVSVAKTEELSILNGVHAIVLDGDGDIPDSHLQPQCPVIALSNGEEIPNVVDITVPHSNDIDAIVDRIEQSPIAVQSLLQLLRHNEHVDIYDALFAESLTYSALQHGEQFRIWLDSRQNRTPKLEPDTPPIVVLRRGNVLELTLNRPEKRNAWSTGMRDALTEALQLVGDDTEIERIVLQANGPCFGAGGDLDEFGSARDAGIAHVTRMTRNPGLLMNLHRTKISAHLHGACVGAGIEVPAFASHVTAKRDSFFQLPEVSMGLIPGAGGTASILRRIGRRNLAKMAITGERVNTETALQWGLIDEIRD